MSARDTCELNHADSSLAIIGMACRFPGAEDPDAFWKNLRDGVESIRRFTDEELLAAGEDPKQLADPRYVKARPVLKNIDMFDAAFFGFNPREAEILDPQQRVFLECVWEAFERAGYDTERCREVISVYAGVSLSNYLISNLHQNRPVIESFGYFQATISNVQDSLATRLAYKLNLKGACVSVQTFCSTSLVATHLACQALLNFECDMAVSGGATIYVPQTSGYLFQDGSILSADGCCRPFDARANGTVFGNGVGVVVLKRAEDALKDGDTIHALIRGSATNNDGSTKVSYAAPSVVGQAAVIVEALAAADVEPESVSYIETHGTGTALGDPVEVSAMTKAFRSSTDKQDFCAIGSLKPNVGHLDAAAGVAGLIKTVQALKHEEIPPQLHYESPNPEIEFAGSPFYVNKELQAWPRNEKPRRAGVSAFGIGGTNAHVIVEEGPETQEQTKPSRTHQLLPLSARTPGALDRMTANLADHLKAHPDLVLDDVAYTLQVGRREFAYRRTFVCNNLDDAVAALTDQDRAVSTHLERSNAAVCFRFAGAGPHQMDVLRHIYNDNPTFQKHVDTICDLAHSEFSWDLRQHFSGADASVSSSATTAMLSEAALFAGRFALARLWMSWGARPQHILGTGPDRLLAGCLAGVFTPEGALRLLSGKERQDTAGLELKEPEIELLDENGQPLDPELVLKQEYWATQHAAAGLPSKLASDPNAVILDFSGELDEGHAQCTRLSALPSVGEDPTARLTGTLGRLWLAGVKIDWTSLHEGQHRRRAPLPTYAFDRKRFWIDPLVGNYETEASSKRSDISQWLYHMSWKTAILPPAADLNKHTYLIFVDSSGVGLQVAERFRRLELDVITVTVGKTFSGDSLAGYTIDPKQPTDYVRLLKELQTLDKYPGTIVHLWSVYCPGPSETRSKTFDLAGDLGFYSLLYLAQALGTHQPVEPLNLKVVSSQLHEVIGQEGLCPEKAPLQALCKVIPQEHPLVRCFTIDLAEEDLEADSSQWFTDQLANELATTQLFKTVAYRRKKRWGLMFDLIPVDASDNIAPCIRTGGVYLITGGLGEVGYVLSAYLAQSAQAKLILLGRSGLPDRDQWDHLIATRDPGDPAVNRIRKVQGLEALGAEVLVVSADVTSEPQMRTAFDQAVDRFGKIQGVIHAAGVLEADTFAPLQQLSRELCQRQFAPKVQGLHVLDKLATEHPLDFVMLTSSLSSVLGGLGYGAYAAANQYMDAFATQKNQTSGSNWYCVNWDQWGFAQTRGGADNKSDLARTAMTPQEGTGVFDRILRLSDIRHIVVSTASLHARIAKWIYLEAPSHSGARTESAATHHSRPAELEDTYVAPTTVLEETLANIWQDALGLDRVGVRDNFFDLGGHSLLTIQVIDRMKRETSLTLNVEDFIFQTLGQMAAACELQLQKKPPDTKPKSSLFGALQQAVAGRSKNKEQ